MRRPLFIPFVLSAFCIPLFGQANTSPQCPTISVFGPVGVVDAGKVATYTARIDQKGKQLELQYKWTVNPGKIINGQGTTAIEVIQTENVTFTATIEVSGLPSECANTVSETSIVDLIPQAVKLDELSGPLTQFSDNPFNRIVQRAKADPTAKLYIIMSGSKRNRQLSIRKKRSIILDRIVRKFGEDTTRVTFVDSNKTDDRVVIWLVPAGADRPLP